MTQQTKFVFLLILLIVSVAGPTVFAQDVIGMGSSKGEMTFQGTGTQIINVAWQNCNSSGCTLEGTATRTAEFRPVGMYKFSSTTARPFKLVATSGVGLFNVDQSSTISFSYTASDGTLVGLAHFTSILQNQGSIAAYLTGTLEVTGGSFGPDFASGPGSLNLTLAIGKNNLSTLVGTTGSISGGIGNLSSLTPASPCRAASMILSTVNGTPAPGGSIWFNANFSVTGIHDGTVLQFQGAFIQFPANGNTYILHVPNAVITFSSSVSCASTSFDPGTNTWQTTVPVSGTNEIFLSGVSFPVPASGLQGGLNLVNWSESFASNTPGVSIQWRWNATVFSSFSTDYNSLGVKPSHQSACLHNNDDPAGTPEKFRNSVVGGARGATSASWSATATAQANCP